MSDSDNYHVMASGDPMRDIIGEVASIIGATAKTYALLPGESISDGESISLNKAKLSLTRGNLVLTGPHPWQAGQKAGKTLSMLQDGNLVLTDASGKVVWQTNTHTPGSYAGLSQAGEFYVTAPNGKPIWTTHTHKKPTLGQSLLKVPVLGDAIKLGEQVTHVVSEPVLLAGAGILHGKRGIKKELGAAKRDLRRSIQNPVLRQGIKGLALVMPALTPVAAGVEAANQLIKAAKSKNPGKALEIIASTAAEAATGNPDAARAISTLKAVKNGALQVGDVVRKAQDTMGVKFSLPKGVTKNKAVTAANTLLKKAKSGNSTAMSIVRQTVAAAKMPGASKNVKAGAKVLAVVHKAQSPSKPGIRARSHGSYGKANRAAKGKGYANAYLVDSTGKVFKGNFKAQ